MSSHTTDVRAPRPRPVRAPAAVRSAVVLWLGAILAGVAEAFVHLALPDPPAAGDLAVRFGIYLVLGALVLALRTGRNAVRWAVAVLMGVVGTLSLVVEPLGWVLGGGSPVAWLSTAGAPELLAAGLRVVHLVAVAAALVTMFRPSATAFFRGRR
ncbi:hypothetical protein [Pseudonocardia sp. KRD291]|uniref:hypothetical protein n=1 Tax=Pseudonocardia sp. KRD291 TaxID=2792007 RepID=UPI001C49E6A8|nr:hypothetical protein [Pseudonocardia sp. KRD291]MBW0104951.1 hypothetical protein [Pseudonocardia sp. KRD291]